MTVIKLDAHAGQPQRFTCLSTDTKPDSTSQSGLEAGANLYETDTGQLYWWDGVGWQIGFVGIDIAHHWIHNGHAFFASNLWATVADDASTELLIQVAIGMHTLYEIAAGGDFDVEVFENPTFSAAGSAVGIFNRNRFSSKESGNIITHTPTITDDGTSMGVKLLPGGAGGNAGGGQDGGFDREIILKAGNDYLIRSTNRSGLVKRASTSLDWYQYTTT